MQEEEQQEQQEQQLLLNRGCSVERVLHNKSTKSCKNPKVEAK